MTTSILWELDSTQKIINLKVQNIHTYHPLCKTKRNLITSTERPKKWHTWDSAFMYNLGSTVIPFKLKPGPIRKYSEMHESHSRVCAFRESPFHLTT